MNIGIVGYGILGQAINAALKSTYNTIIIDPPKGMHGSIEECDKYIVCLPTPENADGSCDTSLVEQYIKSLTHRDVLLKSTVDPSVLAELEAKHDFSYSPEFLREHSSIEDFKHQEFVIFSGAKAAEWCNIFFEAGVHMKNVKFTDIQTAAYAKYIINTFLATKVIFFNEIAELFDGNLEDLIDTVSLDTRMGSSHMNVPGPDGRKGFGGMCFPKDTKALAHHARKNGKPLKLLEEVIKINNGIR